MCWRLTALLQASEYRSKREEDLRLARFFGTLLVISGCGRTTITHLLDGCGSPWPSPTCPPDVAGDPAQVTLITCASGSKECAGAFEQGRVIDPASQRRVHEPQRQYLGETTLRGCSDLAGFTGPDALASGLSPDLG